MILYVIEPQNNIYSKGSSSEWLKENTQPDMRNFRKFDCFQLKWFIKITWIGSDSSK